MDVFNGLDVIPLSYEKRVNNARVSGLAVTVQVTNASTGSVLLAATTCPEIGTTGIYTYNWTHGLNVTTQALVAFKSGVNVFEDSILVTFGPSGGRGA